MVAVYMISSVYGFTPLMHTRNVLFVLDLLPLTTSTLGQPRDGDGAVASSTSTMVTSLAGGGGRSNGERSDKSTNVVAGPSW